MKNLNKKILPLLLLFLTTLLHAKALSFPSLAPVLKDIMPAIVNVAAQGVISETNFDNKKNNNNSKPKKFSSIGSGVILDPKKGIIITNAHVIRNANLITVTTQDGRRLKAKLIGHDSETDLAVLKVAASGLHSITIGDSDKLNVGDFVIAIGNPFGLNSFGNSQSATFGIISALKRSDLNIEGVENFIQTDAAINPGNSGGALVNAQGELVGINTAIISPYGASVGIGFAIPVNMANNIAQQLIKYGSIHRGMMGVFVQHLTPELAQALGYKENLKGALVSQVNKNSPAQKAGVKAGDIIIRINSTLITQATQVKTTVSMLRVNSPVNITVRRNGQVLHLKAQVTDIKNHEQSQQKDNPFLYGLALQTFTQHTPLHGDVKGVRIIGAAENSAGWRSGMRPGDIIVAANKTAVSSVVALQKQASIAKSQLLVQVLRGPGSLFFVID